MASIQLSSISGNSMEEIINAIERQRKDIEFIMANLDDDNIKEVSGEKVVNLTIDQAQINNLLVDTANIRDLAVSNAKIANAAITYAKIADAAIGNAKIDRASVNKLVVTTADIQDASITNAKIDRASVNRLVVSTADIQDASITAAKIASAAIGTAQIEDASITSAKIGTGQITTALIANAAITETLIKDASITDAKIVGLTANKITTGTIDASKINVTNLVADNIVAGTLTIMSANLFQDSDLRSDILEFKSFSNASGTITYNATGGQLTGGKYIVDVTSLTNSSGISVTSSGRNYTMDATYLAKMPKVEGGKEYVVSAYLKVISGSPTGYIGLRQYRADGTFIGNTTSTAVPLENGRIIHKTTLDVNTSYVCFILVTGGEIHKLEVSNIMVQKGKLATEWQLSTNQLLVDKGITNQQIGDSAVDNRVITADTITGDKLVADAITTREIKAGSITAASGIIANATIGTAQIIDASITNAKIGNLAVDTAKIADAAITNAKVKELNADKITSVSPNLILSGWDTIDQLTSLNGSESGWTTLEISKDYPHTGNKSIRALNSTSNSYKYIGDINGIATANPGEKWIASAYVMRPYTGGFNVLIQIVFRDSAGASVGYGDYITVNIDNTKGWQRVYAHGIAPVNTASVAVYFRHIEVNYTAFWDSFQLEKAEDTTQTKPSFFKPSGASVINGGNILAKTITADQMAANSITAANAAIADAAITTAKIADAAITNAKINDLDAAKITAGTIAAARIGAGSITTNKLDVRARSLVNNWTKTGTLTGWSDGSSLVSDSTMGSVARVTTSGNVQIASSVFEVDPTKTYKVTMAVKVPTNNGTQYFGMRAYNASGLEAAVTQFNTSNRTFQSAITNPYFWYSSSHYASWHVMEAYILGCNVTDPKEVPEGKGVSNFFRMPPNATSCLLRFLNYYQASGTTTTSDWHSPSVTEVGTGKITASQLEVTSLSAISANIGNVTAGNISGVNISGSMFTSQDSTGRTMDLTDGYGMIMDSSGYSIWNSSVFEVGAGDARTPSAVSSIYIGRDGATGYIDSANASIEMRKALTFVNGEKYDVNYKEYLTLSMQTDESMRFQNRHGYIDVGTKNTSYAHIYTDRPFFYLNRDVLVSGTKLVKNGDTVTSEFYQSTSELNYCGIGARDPGTTGVIGGTGVGFKIRKNYTPSSVSLTAISSNQTPTILDIRSYGFYMYLVGTGVAGSVPYFRGYYQA